MRPGLRVERYSMLLMYMALRVHHEVQWGSFLHSHMSFLVVDSSQSPQRSHDSIASCVLPQGRGQTRLNFLRLRFLLFQPLVNDPGRGVRGRAGAEGGKGVRGARAPLAPPSSLIPLHVTSFMSTLRLNNNRPPSA